MKRTFVVLCLSFCHFICTHHNSAGLNLTYLSGDFREDGLKLKFLVLTLSGPAVYGANEISVEVTLEFYTTYTELRCALRKTLYVKDICVIFRATVLYVWFRMTDQTGDDFIQGSVGHTGSRPRVLGQRSLIPAASAAVAAHSHRLVMKHTGHRSQHTAALA